MASADDRRAALLLLVLAGLGAAVRLLMGGGGAPGSIGFRPAHEGRPSRDTVVAAAARMARPLAAGELVDVDRASAAELSRLPRIGAGLAARIVRDRDAHGAFGSLDGLGRVRGVGPTVVDAIRPHATFSGRPRAARARPAKPARIAVNRATAEELTSLPGIGPHLAAAIVADRAQHGPYRKPEDLLRVRGIGPVVLERLKSRILVP
jgi:competence ComEA-like helix-hairpin-helix protein